MYPDKLNPVPTLKIAPHGYSLSACRLMLLPLPQDIPCATCMKHCPQPTGYYSLSMRQFRYENMQWHWKELTCGFKEVVRHNRPNCGTETTFSIFVLVRTRHSITTLAFARHNCGTDGLKWLRVRKILKYWETHTASDIPSLLPPFANPLFWQQLPYASPWQTSAATLNIDLCTRL